MVTGRLHWIEVNPQSIYKLKFYENVPTEGWGDLEFELTQTRSFTVDSFFHSPKGMQVRVRFIKKEERRRIKAGVGDDLDDLKHPR